MFHLLFDANDDIFCDLPTFRYIVTQTNKHYMIEINFISQLATVVILIQTRIAISFNKIK